MGIVLFDWKTTRAIEKVISDSFSISCLFDGYLTGIGSVKLKTNLNALFSHISSFDAYLTEH
jgi:hypothetical protein